MQLSMFLIRLATGRCVREESAGTLEVKSGNRARTGLLQCYFDVFVFLLHKQIVNQACGMPNMEQCQLEA